MKKIAGWENLDANNEVVEYTNVVPGIYICQIKNVEDVVNKEYLKIKFDIVKGEYKNIYTDMSGKSLANWPNQGIVNRSYKQSADKFFRAFITAIEKTNASKNYKWNWDEQSLTGLFFVGVFGEEEYLNKNNEVKTITRLQDIRSIQAMNENKIKVPELKKLSAEEKMKQQNSDFVTPAPAAAQPQQNVLGAINDDDLPF